MPDDADPQVTSSCKIINNSIAAFTALFVTDFALLLLAIAIGVRANAAII